MFYREPIRSEIAWRDAKYAEIYEYLREEYEVAQRFGNLDFKLKFVEVFLFLYPYLFSESTRNLISTLYFKILRPEPGDFLFFISCFSMEHLNPTIVFLTKAYVICF